MNLLFPPGRIKHIQRYQEIVRVLLEEGLTSLVNLFGVSRLLSVPLRLLTSRARAAKELSLEERIRLSLEKLGPTFIKLGQILSTRPDLLPRPLIFELEKLQDEVSPIHFSAIREQVERELGRALEDLFKEFEEKPVASASIGQVHAAVTRNGDQVVVKVKKPEADRLIEIDLDILVTQAKFLEEHTEWARKYRLVNVALEYQRNIRIEIDYIGLGRLIEIFQKNFKDNDHALIPLVHWDYTTRGVLTMERIHGIRLSDLHDLDEVGYDRPTIARIGAEMYFKMIFEDGFFHADPHPGNFLVVSEDVIGVMDFGTVGRITDETRAQVSQLFVALINKDVSELVDRLIDVGIVTEETDKRLLTYDIDMLMMRYHDISVRQVRVAEALNDLFGVVYKHRVIIPTELGLLLKTLVTLEGVCTMLDPGFNLIEVGRPFASQLVSEKANPLRWGPELLEDLRQLNKLLRTLPQQISDTLKQVGEGKLKVSLDHLGMGGFMNTLRRVIDQLSLSILIASFVLGSSLIIAQGRLLPPGVMPLTFLILVPAALLGLWLVFSIFTSRK
ncbi:ubiquinone biosynthesis protein [Candidatus Hakubella thermalkaliphila]|uniref:Ubiquinone biosynthesis protein n=1 Tax=Candidatus Hakubella thermalkaliphila TaxID=2754717 RepID=A0A6V8PSD3_9ACTN|nr:AarF/UbiB family protein [Candidatus Hakubella thermalkaliphila]GFP35298.1 ubiquinone biosynthesis protein [Candidatus Hakubella thermalkaliphila]